MTDVIGLVLPFFGLIFLGYLLARLLKAPVEGLAWMNIFILYAALPALFFQLLSRTPVQELAQGGFLFASVSATAIIFATMFVGSRLSGSSVPESTIQSLSAAYGNIGFMGPGLALIAFGEKAAVPIALIFCVENVLHFAVTPTLMALSGEQTQRRSRLALDVVRRIALHPFIIATAIGALAAITQVKVPVALDRLLEILSRAAAPCALFAMGVTLALRPLKKIPASLAPIACLKLIAQPILCYFMLSMFGNFDPVWVWSAVLLASLPTATNVYVLAEQYGVWVNRASASVLITTLCSVVTVTSLLYVIRSGILPPDLFP